LKLLAFIVVVGIQAAGQTYKKPEERERGIKREASHAFFCLIA
jgi:hypothetical protein